MSETDGGGGMCSLGVIDSQSEMASFMCSVRALFPYGIPLDGKPQHTLSTFRKTHSSLSV